MTALVIGIGNPERGDDGVGPFVVACLEQGRLAGGGTLCLQGDPAELLAAWEGRQRVIVVDACASGAEPGAIHRFNAATTALPEGFGAVSTHGFGLGAAIELARAMDCLPLALTVYGIEAESFDAGAPLSHPVKAAAETLVQEITHMIGEASCTKPG